MKSLILPLVLALAGLGAGVGAGLMLKPDPNEQTAVSPHGETDTHDAGHDSPSHDKDAEHGKKTEHGTDGHDDHGSPDGSEYVKLNNQFVVPVVNDDLVDALVVMSLSIEVESGQREAVYAREPKLRDAMLQVLFDHANMGGFSGNFTNGNNLDVLRASLTEAARNVLGPSARSVLIFDIARQDV